MMIIEVSLYFVIFHHIVTCLGTDTHSSDFWLVLFQSSLAITTLNYYTFKIAVIITYKVFNSLLI
jgi:hypothetical protein